ncbi:phospholipase D-like domain-containing protein [Mesomycoplasma ovipneumoniae]|uniref:Phospholipase D-like domain-containing protein n=1 Tax=Mesomycoplasma ovipneumoniae TaxID=29562 RepID=A0AAW6Q4P8_9BACT|nr:phospholipase D-like domain-containing protein [Mesomycoplasma ovipneumoniae]MDF9627550.1 phospholipase D-like domain-containing protein [Mesomycoplasma ovipneumoniae]MDO4157722.1 phospholipase D-like domain-containing protein [Mesomycoplasma ovipneumoniae]MDO4158327.1 phospholipase D-like domain-containing protein [Mesomycoplasma ovipneumoniae]MDO6821682.1 phospholipase D-like domain-containing protein [Mesomycoplasma ovipneumoniae]MDO6855510.1 phospholipase D-like domain-containing protei
MFKRAKWIFYYFFLLIFLAGFSGTIYIIYVFLSRNLDWIAILTLVSVYSSTSLFNLFILLQRRRHEAKISWLIACSILPIIGPIAYIFLGRKYSNHQNVKHYFSQYQYFIGSSKTDEKLLEKIPKTDRDLLVYSSKYFLSPVQKFIGDLIVDGHSFFEKLFNDIQKAKKFIFIDIYIVKNDFIWKKLKRLLINKRKQGVKVKIIVDSFGTYYIKTRQWLELRSQKIEVLLFNAFKVPFISGQSFYRNHRKVFLIDGKIVYTGGNNIAEEYSGFDKNFGYWMDLNLRLEGEIVETYCRNFLFHWSKWGKKNISKSEINNFCKLEENSVQSTKIKNLGVVIQNGPNLPDSLIEGFILKSIYSAKKNIKLFSPYFVPTQKIIDALKDVLLAKIEVEIFIPGRNDILLIKTFNHYFAYKLFKKGAKIYFFKEIFFHGKAIIIDDNIGMVGTSNLDARSLFFQYETNLFFKGKILNKLLNHIDLLKKQNIIVEVKEFNKISNFFKFLIFFLKTLA